MPAEPLLMLCLNETTAPLSRSRLDCARILRIFRILGLSLQNMCSNRTPDYIAPFKVRAAPLQELHALLQPQH
ncbi:hypothetical protein Y032_0119g845 [Ancylostoma ceylanicum]|uniref:Uncharacterized protein n=1 Tax=Ancylostoma ceylanicum TaxID=53326 RepID=A0A016TB60_9BILA|nr:hypothetical protein Y032_0119g845 [Ancylostoma ceylanicum]